MKILVRSALGALLLGLAAMPALAETPKDTVVMAKQIDDIVSLDPAEAYELSGAEVIGNVYDRLVDYDPDAPGKLKPGLASSWKVDADGMTFTFVLRDNARFTTGKPVTAADAAFSLQRAVLLDKAPAVILNAIGLTKENVVNAVVALDQHALEIKLPKPLAPSFVYFCLTGVSASIVDKETVLAHQQNNDMGLQWLETHWAGTGPYRLVMWRPNEYYALEALNRLLGRQAQDPPRHRPRGQGRGDAAPDAGARRHRLRPQPRQGPARGAGEKSRHQIRQGRPRAPSPISASIRRTNICASPR